MSHKEHWLWSKQVRPMDYFLKGGCNNIFIPLHVWCLWCDKFCISTPWIWHRLITMQTNRAEALLVISKASTGKKIIHTLSFSFLYLSRWHSPLEFSHHIMKNPQATQKATCKGSSPQPQSNSLLSQNPPFHTEGTFTWLQFPVFKPSSHCGVSSLSQFLTQKFFVV